ncbi:homeobox-leucine zipper protein HDG11-like [Solanum pennellii]|uniref:Homeobox-leucine zipper protein HDG11-like n=1 Tax=Solanum pennellii TaxID=28526 RepID=A0ABM1FIW3_SOLPN|nr:homeobox-leucine zipper protein HDG11-like [Solanum pennellii]
MTFRVITHFVRKKVARGQVRVLHVPSRYHNADIFTRALPLVLFEDFRDSLSIRRPPASTEECWDILTSGNNVIELDRVLTGNFPGNNITIIQPNNMHKEMFVLEETSIDEMGAFLVYAPIDLRAITSIVNGGDATKVPILPSGIIISPDGRLSSNRDNTANAQNGSILTVTFQIMICGDNNPTSRQQKMEISKRRLLMVLKDDVFPFL